MVVSSPERSWQMAGEFDGAHEGYRHYQKRISPSLDFGAAGVRLKWYDIHFTMRPIGPELDAEARAFLKSEIESGRLPVEHDLGFAILHDCGDVVFLLISLWRNSNELWEAPYLKLRDNGGGFEPVAESGILRPAFCVWEMGAVAHESKAWSRYLNSNRGQTARESYYFDMYSGLI
jgi:hypothetical protein